MQTATAAETIGRRVRTNLSVAELYEIAIRDDEGLIAADGPLVVRTGPANRPDAALALEMLDAIPPCGGRRGRPRRRPKAFPGDGAYGIEAIVAA